MHMFLVLYFILCICQWSRPNHHNLNSKPWWWWY